MFSPFCALSLPQKLQLVGIQLETSTGSLKSRLVEIARGFGAMRSRRASATTPYDLELSTKFPRGLRFPSFPKSVMFEWRHLSGDCI
jgi:hypothetical protein